MAIELVEGITGASPKIATDQKSSVVRNTWSRVLAKLEQADVQNEFLAHLATTNPDTFSALGKPTSFLEFETIMRSPTPSLYKHKVIAQFIYQEWFNLLLEKLFREWGVQLSMEQLQEFFAERQGSAWQPSVAELENEPKLSMAESAIYDALYNVLKKMVDLSAALKTAVAEQDRFIQPMMTQHKQQTQTVLEQQTSLPNRHLFPKFTVDFSKAIYDTDPAADLADEMVAIKSTEKLLIPVPYELPAIEIHAPRSSRSRNWVEQLFHTLLKLDRGYHPFLQNEAVQNLCFSIRHDFERVIRPVLSRTDSIMSELKTARAEFSSMSADIGAAQWNRFSNMLRSSSPEVQSVASESHDLAAEFKLSSYRR